MFSLSLDNRKAKLVQSRRHPGRYELSVDGIAQSVVSMTEPTMLEYAYTQHIARAMDAAAEPGAPLFTVHLEPEHSPWPATSRQPAPDHPNSWSNSSPRSMPQ